MDGKERVNIKPGTRVLIIQKQDQRTGKTTEGIVEAILTRSACSGPLCQDNNFSNLRYTEGPPFF